jgi:hypothetical protein
MRLISFGLKGALAVRVDARLVAGDRNGMPHEVQVHDRRADAFKLGHVAPMV